MRKFAYSAYGALATCVLIAAAMFHTSAQQFASNITLSSGELLEIGVDTDLVNPEYSWILTRDREFVNAQRNRFFQTRQTQPGIYTLDISIQSEDRQRSEFHTFQIEVTEALPPPPTLVDSGSAIIVPRIITNPPAALNGTVAVDPQGDLIKIDASQSGGPIERFSIDLDATTDNDGDGVPSNDADTAGSESEQSGGPLYYYVKPLVSPRTISITIAGRDTPSVTEQIPIIFSGRSSVPTIQGSAGKTAILTEIDGLTVRLTPDIDAEVIAGRSVLFEWDFGDSRKSLLKYAVHSYAQAGTYVVTLAVRDLASGQIIYTGSVQVAVTGETPVLPNPDTKPDEDTSGIAWAAALKISGVLAILLVLGLAAFFILRKIKDLMTGKLQQKFEEVEEKYFDQPKTEAEIVAKTPDPMALRKPEADEKTKQKIIAREKQRDDFSTAREQPVVDQSGPEPPWLKTAGSPKAATKLPASEKPPAPLVPPPPPPMPRAATSPSSPPTPKPESVSSSDASAPETPLRSTPASVSRPASIPTSAAPPISSSSKSTAVPSLSGPVVSPAPSEIQKPSTAAGARSTPKSATAPASERTSSPSQSTPISAPSATSKPAEPPPMNSAPVETAKTTIENPAIESKTLPPVAWDQSKDQKDTTPEEREADRKRRKRQRYRQNKKVREQESKSTGQATGSTPDDTAQDEPIILIQADSLMNPKPEDQTQKQSE